MQRKVQRGLLALFLTALMSLAASAEPLLIFGGKDHSVFLGCLNGSKYDDSSIWNRYGDFGSQYSDRSIWNRYGDYGSRYSDTSPWNRYANNPPVIVDKAGNFYGYFTANPYQDKRCEMKTVLYLIDNYDWVIDNLDKLRDKM